MLLSPLTLALAYTYAQEDPHRTMSYVIITFQAKWLPLVMLAMTFVMESPGVPRSTERYVARYRSV